MKKRVIAMLLICCMTAAMLAGCKLISKEEEKEVDKTDGVVNLEGTYWVHDKLGMGYYFKDNVVEYIYMDEVYKENYELDKENSIVKIGDERKTFSIYDFKLHMEVNKVEVEFRMSNKVEFYALVGIEVGPEKEENKTPQQSGDNSEIKNPTLEGTYWLNEQMYVGYYFKDGTADFISFGTKGSTTYTISGNEILLGIAGAEKMKCEINGSTLTITSGGVGVTYTAVTKEVYESYIMQ